MTNTLATTTSAPDSAAIESVLAQGDLSKLTPAQRVGYINSLCRSLGLNPLTRPVEYITLNGKLTLYARKDATDQLRKIHGVSIDKPEITYQDDWIIVAISARDSGGRTDADVGVVSRKDMRGDFGNALMKAITKAKRRVTLSICGLGMLDETEVDSIPNAQPVVVDHETGEIVPAPPAPVADQVGPDAPPLGAHGVGCITEKQIKRMFAVAKESGWSSDEIRLYLRESYGIEHSHDIPVDIYDSIIDVLRAGRG